MDLVLKMLFTLLAATAGGMLFLRLKVPAGAMIGAMAGAAALNIVTGTAWLPANTRVFTQILAGGFIGIGINRAMLGSLRSLVKPAVILVSCMLTTGFGMGFLIYNISGFGFVTSMFSGAPGGMTDMTLISMEMGADTPTVAVMHLIRMVCVICICPPVIRAIAQRYDKAVIPATAAANIPGSEAGTPETCIPTEIKKENEKPKIGFWQSVYKNAVTIAVAAAGGIIGGLTGVPAGAMLFAVAAVSVFNVLFGKAYMSARVRKIAQIAAGALVGKGVGMQQVLSLKSMLLPAVVLVVSYIASNFLIGFILNKTCKLGMTNSLLAAMPAGASDMALIAGDIGADAPQVALLQVVRLISVVAAFPIVIGFMIK